ncbi:hypothetical protein NH340_JMT07289 [Sarcoptes scabiei]|nr:hypothetical protein NH340_JMT07289 [Sarcoptes scabiei]
MIDPFGPILFDSFGDDEDLIVTNGIQMHQEQKRMISHSSNFENFSIVMIIQFRNHLLLHSRMFQNQYFNQTMSSCNIQTKMKMKIMMMSMIINEQNELKLCSFRTKQKLT